MTSFTNHLNQTINPGDTVLVVTTGYSHRTQANVGIFKGLDSKVRAKVLVREFSKLSLFKKNNIPISWSAFNQETLPLLQACNLSPWDKRREFLAKHGYETYSVVTSRERNTTLQLNRIYPTEFDFSEWESLPKESSFDWVWA